MAPRRRQQPISVSSDDREILNQQKQRYDAETGEVTEWGSFLGSVALLGLAALGIYQLARAAQRTSHSSSVQCPGCYQSFMLAVPRNAPRVIFTRCPNCDAELVVDLSNRPAV